MSSHSVRQTLLISGSRHISDAGLTYARRCVQRAKERGDMYVVVGDAKGVDTAVIEACNDVGLDYFCYGVQPDPRCEAAKYYICLDRVLVARSMREAYRQRDIQMVRFAAQNNGTVMCISNGDLDGGTMHVHQQAMIHGLSPHLKTFNRK